MLSYVLKRILSLIPTLFVVSLVVFLVVYMIPGGPATAILGLEATAEELAALNAELGFDRPFLVQYADWFGGVFQGDWGQSFFLDMSVLKAIGEYFWPTFGLAIYAELISLALSIPMGIIAAYKRGTIVDTATVSVSLLGIALPGFLLSMFLMLFFGVGLKWLPVAGYVEISKGFLEHVRYLVLPALSLGLVQAAYITRMTRSSMLDVLYMNYIRTARAKGLKEKKVIYKHAFRNTMIPLVTSLAGLLPGLFSGAIITEQVFGLPGIGNKAFDAMLVADIPFIMGYNMFLALLSVIGVLLADVMYAVVDPRVKLG